jgi:3-oxoacyl-[acyl-carrier-protein] synthase-1
VRQVYIASDNIITSLGFSTAENMQNMKAGITGICPWEDDHLAPAPFWASRVDNARLKQIFSGFADPAKYNRFEQLAICSVREAVSKTDGDFTGDRTLLIVSTTKGNIESLGGSDTGNNDPMYLWHTANRLQEFFNLKHQPWVVSNACISGVLAISVGARLIRCGQFDRVIVTGADLVTEFVISGFNSFLSLSNGPCKPFDRDRQGLSLGEGAGTVILTSDPSRVSVGYGFSSNDANHISGPSRTGEGLYLAIRKTVEKNDKEVEYISAHGTGTPYNDEMESIAIGRAGLEQVPVNSLKGFWGHTLGAAGIIESVAGIYSLEHQVLFGTMGCENPGVSQPINIIKETTGKEINTFLKIASGFGGCNAALLFFR